MKTIEEKARAYDEAVINGSRLWECGEITREKYEYIFPELKESEDERIRKVLRERIIRYDPNNEILIKEEGISQKQFLAWLEKQGEQNPMDKVEPKFKVGQTIIYKGTENIAPTKMTISDITKGQYWDDNCCIVPISDQDNWELVEQKPAEWSEEDKYICTQIEGVLQECWIKSLVHFGLYKKMRDFLKSLKDRVQPKVEFKLDKRILEATIAFVEQNNHFNCWHGVYKQAVLSALRSIKPQTTWKPSDEQMEGLLWVLENCAEKEGSSKMLSLANSIYDDLKKLREE